jgi:hypothetical protein
MVRGSGTSVALALLLAALAACGGGDGGDADAPATDASPLTACVVRLHGKGERGAATDTSGPVAIVSPTGNADGWGGRQWAYDTDERYASALAVVRTASARCTRVVLHGFSNGGAFVAKLTCRGDSLEGRLAGVVVDDPVPDAGVVPCAPAAGVKVALYWTGALTQAVAGWSCAEQDWTCQGGTTIGIESYAAALGVPAQTSPQKEHAPNRAAPELTAWF